MKIFYVDPCFYYSLLQFSPVLKMKDQDGNVLLIFASNQFKLPCRNNREKKQTTILADKYSAVQGEHFWRKSQIFFHSSQKCALLNHVPCCKIKAHRYYFYDRSNPQIQPCWCKNAMKNIVKMSNFFLLNKKLPLVY